MIQKTKQLKINAGQITDVLASHLFAVNAIPKGFDVTEISSLIKHFDNRGDYYLFDVVMKKDSSE